MTYSFQTFSVGQVLTAAQVNQIEVNIRDHAHGSGSVNGTMGDTLSLVSADAGAAAAPNWYLDRNSASPAASDVLGALWFRGKDSGGNTTVYGDMYAAITDPTDGSEDGYLAWQTVIAGTLADRVKIGAGMWMSGATGGDPGANRMNAALFMCNGTAIPFHSAYTSSNQTITAAGSLTLAHGLGATPKAITVLLVCSSGEAGYSAGDEVVINPIIGEGTAYGVAIWMDNTNVNIRFGSAATTFFVLHKTTGDHTAVTNANWRLKVAVFT